MRRLFSCFILLRCLAVQAQISENAAVRRATEELEKVRVLVAAGAAPRARLEAVERDLAGAQDDLVVAHALYGKVGVEDWTGEQASNMVSAARRQMDRETLRLESLQKLVDQGVAARTALAPVLEDLANRRKTLDLALSRSELISELAATAKREASVAESDQNPDQSSSDLRVAERFDGNGVFRDSEFKNVILAFEKKFSHPLPVSARGETALHRALGIRPPRPGGHRVEPGRRRRGLAAALSYRLAHSVLRVPCCCSGPSYRGTYPLGSSKHASAFGRLGYIRCGASAASCETALKVKSFTIHEQLKIACFHFCRTDPGTNKGTRGADIG